MLLNFKKILTVLLLLAGFVPFLATAQTTIINAANNTGTSGADGSFQNATNTFPANGWVVVNGATNKWFTGTQSFCVGTKGAYVGTATGNNNYTNTTSDVSHFYKDVTFPAGLSCITLTFSWKAAGESTFDGLHVYVGSTSTAPVGGTVYTTTDATAVQVGNTWYNQQTTCGTATITLPTSLAGTTKRLVFSWQNDNSVGTNPAGTIDAVSLIAQAPTVPGCATALSPANAATAISPCLGLSWTAPATSGCNGPDSYDIYFGTSATPPFLANTTATSYLTPMSYSTTYYWQIRPKNTAGAATGCAIQSFTTGPSSNPQFNLVGNATSASPYNCVTLTPDAASQLGCAWDGNSTLNFLSDFMYEMDVNLGSNDAGADGMTFVIQNDPLGRCICGNVGGALGAGGITNSVTIEIDTYINFEDRDDFVSPLLGCAGTEDPDHLDIWFNGVINPDLDGNCDAVAAGERVATPNAVRLQSSPGVNYNVENGLTHKFRIAWTAATSTLTATLLNSALTVTYGTISSTFNPTTTFGTSSPYFGYTASTGMLTNQQTFCLPGVLLPVELLDFTVKCTGDGQSLLQWDTETERNNAYFTMEKSCDGLTFAPLSQVKGAGTTITEHGYSLTDANQCDGINYYRLSQTDVDGTSKILGIRSVQSCSNTIITAFPNPATDQLTVQWNTTDVESIALFNAMGQRIPSSDRTVGPNESSVKLDVSELSAGIYYVTVYQLNTTKTIKVIIE